MQKILLLIKTSRPLLWSIGPLVFLIGLSSSSGTVTPLAIFQIILLSFPYCILAYGINDIYDYESDKINPRKRLLQGIKLEPKYHSFIKKSSIIALLLIVTSALFSLSVMNIVGALILLFFTYYYSAPPLRFKERPPLDSISNGMLYFLGPCLMGVSFGSWTLADSIQIFFTTFCVMGFHAFTTIMDYEPDKRAGERTFAIAFGKRAASLFALTVFIVVLLFGKFENIEINYYLIFCSLLFLIIFIFPSERLASLFGKLIFIGFLITAAIYLL